MDNYEGFTDLLSNSIRYGLSNKRAIIVWGVLYLVTTLIYFVGFVVLMFYIKNALAWVVFLLSAAPIVVMSVMLFGYIGRCLSGLFEGEDTAPDVAGLVDMAVGGLKIAAIYVEGIAFVIIIFLPLILVAGMSYRYPETIYALCLLYPLEIVLAVLVLALNVVQWAVFTDTGSLLSGLNPIAAARLIAGDLRYAAVAAIAAFILYLISSIATSILMFLMVTIILLPFAITPFYIAGIYILARFYEHAAGRSVQPSA
jgi:hypothetical protein